MTEKSQATRFLSPHRQRKHDAMVAKILAAARAIMREQGVAALSIQELARRLDLRPPSLYHYFSGKMEIYDTLFRMGVSMLGEIMEQRTNSATTWQGHFRSTLSAYLDFAKQNPDLYQLCFERPVPGFVPSEESLQVSFQGLHKAYERTAEFKKTIRTDLSEKQMTDLLIVLMHGITAMHMSNEPELPPDQGRFGPLIPVVIELLENSWLPANDTGSTNNTR